MQLNVEEVFRTEGVPEFTFVQPPNFREILVDVRTVGKPVIIEGQSGTGKTTTVRKILDEAMRDSGLGLGLVGRASCGGLEPALCTVGGGVHLVVGFIGWWGS